MKKIIFLLCVSAGLAGCPKTDTVVDQQPQATPSQSQAVEISTGAQAASTWTVSKSTLQEQALKTMQVPSDAQFDRIVVPGKNMKGRLIKTPYPEVMGDTRKFVSVKTLSIPRYIVSFDKKAGESAQASAGFTGPQANAHVVAKLTGVDEATFQRITNKAYRDFEEKLRDAGYDVWGIDKLKTTIEYQTWNDDYPKVSKKASKYMADGMRNFSFYKTYFRHGNLMNETRAAIVEPSFAVNFAAFGTQSKSRVGFEKSEAEAAVTMGSVVHVNGVLTGTTLNKCDKRGQCFGDAIRTQTGQPTYSTQPFGTVTDTTSGVVEAVQTVTNVLSMLSGGSTRSDSEKTVTAHARAYEKAALEALFEANTRFVNKLKAGDKT